MLMATRAQSKFSNYAHLSIMDAPTLELFL